MKLFLRPDLAKPWSVYRDPFEAAKRQSGKIYRQLEGRRTLSFTVEQNNYFLKLHQGIGWREIIKNLLNLRLPVVGARNEYKAIQLLNKHSIPTMTVAGFGQRGFNPATQLSFIVTDEIKYQDTLESLTLNWKHSPPVFSDKLIVIKKLAHLARQIHDVGLNHRDFYLCHFLITNEQPIELAVIDLHRAQIRKHVPYRWRVKDLAGLFFSSLDAGLNARDLLRFIKAYNQNEQLRKIFKRERAMWLQVREKGLQLYQKEQFKRR